MSETKVAVVLMNLGGPDSLEAVEPFLRNLFSDRDIFKIPFGQKFFAKIISKSRAPGVVKQYEQIGGKSPINEITEKQRELLETALRKETINADVYSAMRYWDPTTKETARKIEERNYDKIILLPLYPHYSIVTVGSAFNEWDRVFKGEKDRVVKIKSYYDKHFYLKAINQKIDEALNYFPKGEKIFILFSAHSVPQSVVRNGDPYQMQIEESVDFIMRERGRENAHSISYQSKVGPVKWLEPSTEETIKKLGSQGIKNLLVVPISFVSDNLETLYELKIEYGKVAKENGVENFVVTEGLNDSKIFIELLKHLVKKLMAEK